MLTFCTSASQNTVKPVVSSSSHKLQLASFSVVRVLLSPKHTLIACTSNDIEQQRQQYGTKLQARVEGSYTACMPQALTEHATYNRSRCRKFYCNSASSCSSAEVLLCSVSHLSSLRAQRVVTQVQILQCSILCDTSTTHPAHIRTAETTS
jgi:hypothetical protein